MTGQTGETSPHSRIGDPVASVVRAPKEEDCWLQAALMAAAAIFIGTGIPADDVYTSRGMLFLTCGLFCCLTGLLIRGRKMPEQWGHRLLPAVLAAGIVAQCVFMIVDLEPPLPESLVWPFQVRLVAAAVLGILGLLHSPMIRLVRIAILAIIFLILAVTIIKVYKYLSIDVYAFQTRSAKVLFQGGDPFDSRQVRFPNVYPREGAEFLYGQGVVDFTPAAESPGGTLRHGFPYPPVSLLLVLPGQILGGDIRYSGIAAILLSASLMAFARPGRFAPLAACLFLFTPRVFYILREAWTEPLLVFTFSVAMFCACRCPGLLPYALGIFLATKQYTILLVPLVLLLVNKPGNSCKEVFKLLVKAIAVAAVLTLPFALWNFREFWGSVVEWQFVQPFRMDSCSYLVTLARLSHGWHAPSWTAFVAVIPAIGIVLWRGVRSPAGFAAAAGFVCLVFFLFSKQSFSNYYYFVIGALCWAVAAARLDDGNSSSPATELK